MRPSTHWREVIADGEGALFDGYAREIRDIQRRIADGGLPRRALHAKTQTAAVAELRIREDIPSYARVGIFATPGTYRAYVRFSNGSNAPERDLRPDVRGFALKVCGVPGKKLLTEQPDATTQDFLMMGNPRTPFTTAVEFLAFLRAVSDPRDIPRSVKDLGLLASAKMLARLAKDLTLPLPSLATAHYYSGAAVRWGDYAARYGLRPHTPPAPETPLSMIVRDGNYLADDMARRLRTGSVSYDLRAQFFVNEGSTPIEDTSVAWSEDVSPFVPLATLVLATQDPLSSRGRRITRFIESLAFDVWHAPEEFRPIGATMRARHPVYRASRLERGAAGEPDGTESFEDPASLLDVVGPSRIEVDANESGDAPQVAAAMADDTPRVPIGADEHASRVALDAD
jgi:hypothetical protein